MTRRSSSKTAPKLVNQVIDTLMIRLGKNAQPSQWLRDVQKKVIEYRAKLEKNPELEKLVIQHPDLGSLTVYARTGGHYDFGLSNPKICEIKVWNPDKWDKAVAGQTGQFYITFRSEFLQFKGTQAAIEYLGLLETVMCSPEPLEVLEMPKGVSPDFWRVSNIDLTVDTQEPRGMKWSDLDLYTCRSKKRDAFKKLMLDSIFDKMIRDSKKAPPRNNKGGGNGNAKPNPHAPHGQNQILNSVSLKTKVAELAAVRDLDLDNLAWVLERTLTGVGFDPDLGEVTRVVSNGSSELETVYFGRFGSPLYAKRYDKVKEISVSSKQFMRDVWLQNGWDGESPVWRTEFRLSGDFLRAIEIDGVVLDLRDFSMCLLAIPRLWQYLTHEWLVHHTGNPCNVSHDAVRKRPASELWKIIQGAHHAGEAGIFRSKIEPKPIFKQLEAQAKGIVTTMLAMADSQRFRRSIDTVTGEVFDPLTEFITGIAEFFGSDEGVSKIKARQIYLGLDPLSDTALSNLARAEIMALGRGS
jgi:hypothetical protein